ncbi:MAG TPA: hypothetical protein VEA38_12445 [Terriglobales bacterium]|nr:hypothetical protein [Terriglobales bacterium]
MNCDLGAFDLAAMLRCSQGIRRAAQGAPSMEAAASAVCRYLYDELGDGSGGRACVMVRFYKTHPYGALTPELQRFAKRVFGTMAISPPEPAMKCLTLLATVGDEPAWNDRRRSEGHQAIPLPSPYVVERAPMIAQLIREFGMELSDVVRPAGDVVRALGGKSYGVFHVENAAGSPYIPAQEGFVDRYGIRSVVGFGGLLPMGDLFGVILFSRVHVTIDTADRFRSLALDLKSCLIPYGEGVFQREPDAAPAGA